MRRLWERGGPFPPCDAAAYLAGLLFALHPICVESVAWISELKNTLSTVFYLASALVYLGAPGKRGPYLGRDAALPPGGFEQDRDRDIAGGDFNRLVVAQRAPGLERGRSAFGSMAGGGRRRRTIFSLGGTHSDRRPLPPSLSCFLQRCLLAGRVFWFYLGKLVWPANLIFIYPRWVINAAEGRAYFYTGAAIGLLLALWGMRRPARAPLAAFLYFAASLFPVAGFFNVHAFI